MLYPAAPDTLSRGRIIISAWAGCVAYPLQAGNAKATNRGMGRSTDSHAFSFYTKSTPNPGSLQVEKEKPTCPMPRNDNTWDCHTTFDCKPAKYPNTGLATFCRCLADALADEALRNGEKIQLYTPRGFGKIPRGAIARPRRAIDKIFYFCTNRPKVWHCSNQLCNFIPSLPGLRVVTTVHDLNFLHENLPPDKRKRLERRVTRVLKRSDYLVTISDFTREDLRRHFDTGDTPIRTIYNGCRPYEGPLQAPASPPSRPFLFTVGTVLPKKNFHVLPCLLEGNDWELLVAGNRSDYGRRILREARTWGVEDRVKLLGPVPEAEKHWYLSHCKAFVFPSLAEGFGLPVVEAMQYGKPVFLSCHTSLPEIGGPYAFYFNRDFDRRLMQKEFRQGMAAWEAGHIDPAAMRQYARSFSWENAAREYWKVYKEVQQTPRLARRICRIEQESERQAAQEPACKFRLWQLLLCPPAAFLRDFFLQGGFLLGKDGLIQAGLAAYKEFCLHKSRYERQHSSPKTNSKD